MINELTQKQTAIKTAANSSANVFTTVIASPTLVGSATATATTTVPFSSSIAALVTSPVLPASGATLIAKDVASYTAAILPTSTLTEVAGGTPASYVLQGKVGTGSLTIAENASGTAPFAGNGVVKESVVFTGTDKDTLVINSATASVNTPDSANQVNTEFGSSVDALNQNRQVVYTNTDKGIASTYSFATTHAFNEAANGNQGFADGTHKIYNYNDNSVQIASGSQTTSNAATNFTTGAESLVKSVALNYSYTDKATKSTLAYIVAQNETSITTGAVTTDATTLNIAKFALVDNSVAGNALTVTLSNGNGLTHKQVFTDNGDSTTNQNNAGNVLTSETYNVGNLSLDVANNDYSLHVAKFSTDTTTPAAGTSAAVSSFNFLNSHGLNLQSIINTAFDQSFTNSFNNTATASTVGAANNQVSTLSGSFLSSTSTFVGTSDNDLITVKSTINGKVSAGAGDDTVIGGAGNDTIAGNDGNDSINGGAGNDVLYGNNGNDTLNGGTGADTMTGGAGADTFVIGLTDSGITLATADTITDFITGVDKLSLGAAGSATDFNKATVAVKDFATAQTAANTALAALAKATPAHEDYSFQFVTTGTGAAAVTTGYLFEDTTGTGTASQVIVLTGVNAAGIVAADIVA